MKNREMAGRACQPDSLSEDQINFEMQGVGQISRQRSHNRMGIAAGEWLRHLETSQQANLDDAKDIAYDLVEIIYKDGDKIESVKLTANCKLDEGDKAEGTFKQLDRIPMKYTCGFPVYNLDAVFQNREEEYLIQNSQGQQGQKHFLKVSRQGQQSACNSAVQSPSSQATKGVNMVVVSTETEVIVFNDGTGVKTEIVKNLKEGDIIVSGNSVAEVQSISALTKCEVVTIGNDCNEKVKLSTSSYVAVKEGDMNTMKGIQRFPVSRVADDQILVYDPEDGKPNMKREQWSITDRNEGGEVTLTIIGDSMIRAGPVLLHC